MKQKVAIVRGAFLNRYEMQFFEPLTDRYSIQGFASLFPFHTQYDFPIQTVPSPLDIPDFPYKMQVLNRLFVDAHYLYGLQNKLKGFDLVHTAETYFHYTQQCLDAKRKGYVKAVVATVLENIPLNNEGIRGRKKFKQRARNELDHIIALTERSKTALLVEGADEKKITVISHFIDTKRFTPKKSHHETINILFCGRLERYKGVYDILSAIKLLTLDTSCDSVPFSLTFVGDGSEKEGLLAMEQQLGIQHLITHTQVSYDDIPHMYEEADIYVAPSTTNGTWIEQYNTTLLEAQSSGLPIVTTISGGIPENVGSAALLVPPNDPLELSKAIKRFLLSPSLRQEYAKKARARALSVHDSRIGAEKIAHVWESVLQKIR